MFNSSTSHCNNFSIVVFTFFFRGIGDRSIFIKTVMALNGGNHGVVTERQH
ncbi:hypothetical protein VB774_17970 [Pseudanabaena galeata UHCC 0370]|uniref:Uncharacterized protein n=1 Tax=Pseudanabaena galeata UHCC 0370 TaxID=3110310 RepID=A0ABU5TNA6_9CYAN|nr:hypothetical protein [Pseudanabaena galeata]MEA5479511.1 hypothetical protein [Pseudanabaena galeata UHCC 0370]